MGTRSTPLPAPRTASVTASPAAPVPPIETPDVQVWVPAIRAGDIPAFEALFRTLYAPVTRYLRRLAGSHVAEELAQDVFVALWNHRASLDPARSVRSYVFRAAHNAGLNHLLRQHRERRALGRAPRPAVTAEPVDDAAAGELLAAVQAAMATLPPRCRQIYILSREQHLSHAEIGGLLGISAKTVENHMGRTLRHLRRALGRFLD